MSRSVAVSEALSDGERGPDASLSASQAAALQRLREAVVGGEAFIALTAEAGLGKTAILNGLIASLADRPVRFVRVGNGLTAPLSAERVLMQIGPDEPAEPEQDGAAQILRALTRRPDGERQVVVAVEEAETLQPAALALLELIPAVRVEGAPILQVLFIGRPSFWTLLDEPAFGPLRERLATRIDIGPFTAGTARASPHPVEGDARVETTSVAEQSAGPASSSVASPPAEAAIGSDAPPRIPAAPVRMRRRFRFIVPLLLLGGAGAGFVLLGLNFFYRSVPSPFGSGRPVAGPGAPAIEIRPAPAPVPAPVPAPASVPAPAPRSGQPAAAPELPAPPPDTGEGGAGVETPPPVAPHAAPARTGPPPAAQSLAPEARQRLRREFDAFLAATGGDTARLSEPQRDALFNEYLARRAASDGPAPSNPPAPQPGVADPTAGPQRRRVVIHFPAGSDTAEAQADRLAGALEGSVSSTELRAVGATPHLPTVRFFFSGDAQAAASLAATLRGDGAAEWRIQDFTSFRPQPSRGTLEVWIPGG